MSVQSGLVINGDDQKDDLIVRVVHEDNGDTSVYNIILGGAGSDNLNGVATADQDIVALYGVQLFGEDGNDHLSDSAGDDTLSGGTGNDTVFSAYGHDIIDGGDGIDTLTIYRSTTLTSDMVTISGVERLNINRATKIADFDLSQFDLITSFGDGDITFTQQTRLEGVKFGGDYDWLLTGSSFDDTFDLSSSRRPVEIRGGEGNDTILGGSGLNRIQGQAGDDTITGGSGHDVLEGGAGDDIIWGGGGSDSITEVAGRNTIHGGDGNDIINVKGGPNYIYGDDGKDKFYLSKESAFIAGGAGDDTFYGSFKDSVRTAQTWTVVGGEGGDVLWATANMSNVKARDVETLFIFHTHTSLTIDAGTFSSFDRIIFDGSHLNITLSSGGAFKWKKASDAPFYGKLYGSDEGNQIDMSANPHWTIIGGDGDDVVTHGLVLRGGAGDDWLANGLSVYGGNGDDALKGTWALFGENGDDTLLGKSGATMHGGNDDDVLQGGKLLYGGNGNDVLDTTSRQYSAQLYGEAGNDILKGGKVGDVIDGGSGNDTLYGGRGNDDLYLGKGNDKIVIGHVSGQDTVHAFANSGRNHDIVDLSAVSTVRDYSDLIKNHAEEYHAAGGGAPATIIELGGDNRLILDHVALADLNEAMFIF